MSIRDPEKLKEILSDPKRLAKAFSRHTYGMLAWVDLFGDKLKTIKGLDDKLVVTKVIADNAKHAKLFSDRALVVSLDDQGERPGSIYGRRQSLVSQRFHWFDSHGPPGRNQASCDSDD